MRNSWSIIYLTKDYEAFRAYKVWENCSGLECGRTAADWSVGELQGTGVCENCRGLESEPERGGIGSVIELAMAKQVYQKIDDFTT